MRHLDRNPQLVLPLLAVLICGGCETTAGTGATDGDGETGAEAPADTLPTPFTAEQIREAHPEGAFRVYRVEREGEAPVVRTLRFVRSDADGAVVESGTADTEGRAQGPVSSSSSTWEEFRDHARFPAAGARRERAEIQVPAGTYDCWNYVVVDPDGGVLRYWFADDEPGPPVLLESVRDGHIGYRMTLLQVGRPD